MADEDAAFPPGLEEANTEFERVTRIAMMDDAALLHAFDVLSDGRRLQRSHLLVLVEEEVRRRGLAPPN